MTTDPNLTPALHSVSSYFAESIPYIISAVTVIFAFLWLIRLAMRSFATRKPSSGLYSTDGGKTWK